MSDKRRRTVFEVTAESYSLTLGDLMAAVSRAVYELKLGSEVRIVILESKEIFEGIIPAHAPQEEEEG